MWLRHSFYEEIRGGGGGRLAKELEESELKALLLGEADITLGEADKGEGCERQCLLKEDSADSSRSLLRYRFSAESFPQFSSRQAAKTMCYANVERGLWPLALTDQSKE